MYQSGRLSQKFNILTRRSQNLSINIFNERITNRIQILLPPKDFEKLRLIFINIKLDEDESEINK